ALLDKEIVENQALRLAVELGARVPAVVPAINRTAQALVSDRMYRAAGHDVFVTPRRVRCNEMEYALPFTAGTEAIREIRETIEAKGWSISFPIEVRCAAADDVPLSTATGRRRCTSPSTGSSRRTSTSTSASSKRSSAATEADPIGG